MDISRKIQKNVSLAPLTTFKIGGKAKFFVEVKSKNELIAAAEWAKKNDLDFCILGGGSNILISDGIINKLFIKISPVSIEIKNNRIKCGAGTPLNLVIQKTIKNNLTGLEWAMGIPGTIGGAVRGNALAFKSAMSDVVEKVEAFDLQKNKFVVFNKQQCHFVNKGSIFKQNSSFIIWDIYLKLKKEKEQKIAANLNRCLSVRKNHPKLPSAGCVFKNFPASYVKNNNAELYQEAKENKILRNKLISAGWIISRTGLPGKKVGGAQISLEHANFIVNTGRAKAEDVIILIGLIKQKLRTEYNLQLQEEIEYIGFD